MAKDDDKRIVGLRALWERVKVSHSDEAVSHYVANQLGVELEKKGKHKEAKVFFVAALEGRRRVLGDEHIETLGSLHNLGSVPDDLKDYEGALDYYQQALRA